MRFGIVGLGRMGLNIALQAVENGHLPVGYDVTAPGRARAADAGIEVTSTLDDLVRALPTRRVILVYVPHGAPTDEVCGALAALLSRGDVIADAGNSHWRDSAARSRALGQVGLRFLDIGTSGGLEGARRGACFMVGGDRSTYEIVRPLLRDLAVDDDAVLFAGEPGSGHFTKLVHNAIEFGMLQAIGEGVEMLARGPYGLDAAAVFENWNHGSVIRSWLVGLMAKALRHEHDLEELSTFVEDTGEVKWVLEWSMGQDIPTPVVSASQTALMNYRDVSSVQAKAVALLRNQFGAHRVHRACDASSSEHD